MRAFTINNDSNGKTVEQAVCAQFKQLKKNALFKAFRKKNIKVNGRWVKNNEKVFCGDVINVYITDDVLFGETHTQSLAIVYEDDNIIIVNKPQGMDVHPGNTHSSETLIELLNKQFGKEMFLCHRLDRNTGGLIMVAKSPAVASCVSSRIKNNDIIKHYRCVCVGIPSKESSVETAYMLRDIKNNKMFVVGNHEQGSNEIITKYTLLDTFEVAPADKEPFTASLLDVELVTGRTHQIRAHLAFLGLPIIGDGKYGINTINRACKMKQQFLYSYSLEFSNSTYGDLLDYCRGIRITLPHQEFDIANNTIIFP